MYNRDKSLSIQEEKYKYYEFHRKQERYFKRLKLCLVLVLVALSGYLFDQRPVSLSVEKAILALGIIWLGLIPSLQYLSDQNRPPMPFFPLVGLFYATSFGLPMFAADKKVHYVWSLANVSEEALFLTLLGVALMNIAFYTSKFSFLKKITPIRLPQSYKISKLTFLLWFLLVSHIAYLYIPFLKEIPSLGHLLYPVGYIAYGMFYILRERGQLSLLQILLVFGLCFPIEIVPLFISGSLALVMLLGLFMVIVIFYEKKQIPTSLIIAITIFFLIFNPIKGEYRNLVWFQGLSSELNPIEKVQLFINIAIENYLPSDNDANNQSSIELASNSTLSRTAHIIVFSEVVKDTPARVPYWGGQTYLPLLTSFIPRAILPDKALEDAGNRFGRRYSYLASNDFTTSFNLPWIVEMYANFGDIGVLIGMSGVGLILAFLEQKLNHTNLNPLEFVTGTTILFRLIYQESNFSLMVGSIIILYLSLYLMFKFFLSDKIIQ